MNIRRALVDDAPKLAQVHVDSWQVAYRNLIPDSFRQGFTYARREEAFRQALAAGREETYLVEEDERPIAILTFGASRDSDLDAQHTGEIWGIYIIPDCWRRGIGTELVQEAEQMLRARGFQDIVLWVFQDNMEARRFYEAVGYAPDGAGKILELGAPLKAVRYRKAFE